MLHYFEKYSFSIEELLEILEGNSRRHLADASISVTQTCLL